MSHDLKREVEVLRKISFGTQYRRVRAHLETTRYASRREEFTRLEDYFLHMISFILSSQDESGWWEERNELRNVITAHSVRHLYKMGISLKGRWNLEDQPPPEGNLFRAIQRLVGAYGAKVTHSYWGTDIWDDCYILMTLLEIQPALEDAEVDRWDQSLRNRLEEGCNKSLDWLKHEIGETGFISDNVTKADWYGPGFYAAAIELFTHPRIGEYVSESEAVIAPLAAKLQDMISTSFTGVPTKWHNRYAWHAGQALVTWKEKRDSVPALRNLDAVMEQLLGELKDWQSVDGSWDNQGNEDKPEYRVYYTVRGLAACYVNADDTQILDWPQIEAAHRFLLARFREHPDGKLVNSKASINGMGALQRLFGLHIHGVIDTYMLSLAARVNKLGLMNQVLSLHGDETKTLRQIRLVGGQEIEKRGHQALEMLGVNRQLYNGLEKNKVVVKEFTGDRSRERLAKERDEILEDLRRCLSATLTETRSKYSHKLIMRLWDTDGFLNFKPLIDHLSLLEQDRAFYKFYRDHLNHELLLFLLGAYLYYECKTFRTRIDDEMRRIYDQERVPDPEDLPGEFLFRWKLISTFHDIGYLFEVDPFEDKVTHEKRTKTELIAKSWQVVDGFRANFLEDYFMQTIEPSKYSGMKPEQAKSSHEAEIKNLAAEIYPLLKDHPPEIKSETELLSLSTVSPGTDPFKLISQFINPGHIGPNLVKNYFYLCGALPVEEEQEDGTFKEQRTAYYDHGIMSALILLKATDLQRHYLKQLSDEQWVRNLKDYPKVSALLRRKKTSERLNADEFFIRFSHVAGAIALHNISPGMYRQDQCAQFDASSKRSGEGIEKAFYPAGTSSPGYIISLDENPLSYLTALADTLQDWDRHSFRRLWFDDDSDPLTSSEVTIAFNQNGKLLVKPLTEAARKKYQKIFSKKGMCHLQDWNKYIEVVN